MLVLKGRLGGGGEGQMCVVCVKKRRAVTGGSSGGGGGGEREDFMCGGCEVIRVGWKKNKDRDNCMAYDIGVTAKKKPNPAWYMKTATGERLESRKKGRNE